MSLRSAGNLHDKALPHTPYLRVFMTGRDENAEGGVRGANVKGRSSVNYFFMVRSRQGCYAGGRRK